MTNTQTSIAAHEAEFLFISNLFDAAPSAPAANISEKVILTSSPAERVFRMVKNGNFGFNRQEIIDAFIAVGGSNNGAPVDYKAIIKLCLDVVAQSHKNSKSALRLWFDPFTGRLELELANGLCDSLQIYTRNIAMAA